MYDNIIVFNLRKNIHQIKEVFMKVIFINYPKCSTCQKAKKFLDDHNVQYEDRNIVTDTPTVEELKKWIEMSELPINKFFNTSGMLYRSMNLKESLKVTSDEEKIQMLASDGMLIKRPILVLKDNVLVGFKEESWLENISKK
jgi:arsenate reductase